MTTDSLQLLTLARLVDFSRRLSNSRHRHFVQSRFFRFDCFSFDIGGHYSRSGYKGTRGLHGSNTRGHTEVIQQV